MQNGLEDRSYAGKDYIRKMGERTKLAAKTIYGGHPKP